MKIYRVGYNTNQAASVGFAYFTTKKSAEKSLSDFKKEHSDWVDFGSMNIEVEDVEISKAGILSILNQWASHPDNG